VKEEAQATEDGVQNQPKKRIKLTEEQAEALIQRRARTFTPTRVVFFSLISLLLTIIPIFYGLRVSNVEVPTLDFRNKNLYFVTLSPLVSAGILAYCHCIYMQQKLLQVLNETQRETVDSEAWMEAACYVLQYNNSVYFVSLVFLVGYFFINSIPVIRFSVGGLSSALVVLALYEKNK